MEEVDTSLRNQVTYRFRVTNVRVLKLPQQSQNHYQDSTAQLHVLPVVKGTLQTEEKEDSGRVLVVARTKKWHSTRAPRTYLNKTAPSVRTQRDLSQKSWTHHPEICAVRTVRHEYGGRTKTAKSMTGVRNQLEKY